MIEARLDVLCRILTGHWQLWINEAMIAEGVSCLETPPQTQCMAFTKCPPALSDAVMIGCFESRKYATHDLPKQGLTVLNPSELRDARRAVGGSVGCGKSTLVAVLSHGAGGRPALDDGRGRARTPVLRHRHEIQSGHTSSISQCILGYDGRGVPLNYNAVSAPTPAEIGAAAAKVLHFIDLCGHSRFFKTALYGLNPRPPHHVYHSCLNFFYVRFLDHLLY